MATAGFKGLTTSFHWFNHSLFCYLVISELLLDTNKWPVVCFDTLTYMTTPPVDVYHVYLASAPLAVSLSCSPLHTRRLVSVKTPTQIR